MSLCPQDKINTARVILDNATANVAAYAARRQILNDAAQVPPEELRDLRAQIECCRHMIDTLSEVAHG